MKIAVVNPSNDGMTTLIPSLGIAGGMARLEGACNLILQDREPGLESEWENWEGSITVRCHGPGMSPGDLRETWLGDGGPETVVLSSTLTDLEGIEELQDGVDAVLIACRSLPTEEARTMALWQRLEERWQGATSERGFPVLLPVDCPPLETATLALAEAEYRRDRLSRHGASAGLRMVPPSIPSLPLPVLDSLYDTGRSNLPGMITGPGERTLRYVSRLRELGVDIDEEATAELWMQVASEVPWITLSGDRLIHAGIELNELKLSHRPHPAKLAAAPVIHDWYKTTYRERVLGGHVEGHPRIPDGHRTLTSQLIHIDPVQGIGRTLSRLYRLGTPYSDGDHPDPETPGGMLH